MEQLETVELLISRVVLLDECERGAIEPPDTPPCTREARARVQPEVLAMPQKAGYDNVPANQQVSTVALSPNAELRPDESR